MYKIWVSNFQAFRTRSTRRSRCCWRAWPPTRGRTWGIVWWYTWERRVNFSSHPNVLIYRRSMAWLFWVTKNCCPLLATLSCHIPFTHAFFALRCVCLVITLIGSIYRVCHGFRFTTRDDYFRVDFDHFWSKQHFLRQQGQLWKTAWAYELLIVTKLSLPKSAKITVQLGY